MFALVREPCPVRGPPSCRGGRRPNDGLRKGPAGEPCDLLSGAGGAWLRRLIDCNPATSYEDRGFSSKMRQPERQSRIGRSDKRPIQQQQSWRYLIEEENKWDA